LISGDLYLDMASNGNSQVNPVHVYIQNRTDEHKNACCVNSLLLPESQMVPTVSRVASG